VTRRPTPKPTTTSAFGVSRRENHDATEFYERFAVPELSADSSLAEPTVVDQIVCGDARSMDRIADDSVALVVTSPPYFAGKAYEQALGEGHIPGSYVEYLEMLRDVFAECVRCLEPGGRIAVNVANLGRKPYRSLSADVIGILQDDLRLLLRGEVIWVKARGAGGNCAWGSFQRPGNPVLRDLTERVIIASKGRFDRAVPASKRAQHGQPSVGSISKDEFMEATTDVWELPTESAIRVGHPAPFPIELPQRLIDLYTYRGDLVLDPFMGSGTTALAAVRSGRHFMGYDTDPGYVSLADARVHDEVERRRAHPPVEVMVEPGRRQSDDLAESGATANEVAERLLTAAGFTVRKARAKQGAQVTFEATTPDGDAWWVDVVGSFTAGPSGLRRSDLLWRTIGRATVLRQITPDVPVLVLATEIPADRSPAGKALSAVHRTTIAAVLDLRAPTTPEALRAHAAGATRRKPITDADELTRRRQGDGIERSHRSAR
jgi:site-specific DNA-methyltransferase (adenine-specific)